MGNTEILRRGDLQLTSAGTGITHSEKTHGSEPAHFLQIWSVPSASRLEPKYYTRHFADEEKKDKWARVVAPFEAKDVVLDREGQGPAPVHSPLTMYASVLSPGTKLKRALEGTKGYVHVIQTSGYNEGKATGATVKISSQDTATTTSTPQLTLKEGDGAYVLVGQTGNVMEVQNDGDRVAEVVVFDLE